MTRVWHILGGSEKALAIAAMSLMSLLPVIAMAARQTGCEAFRAPSCWCNT